MRHDPLPVKRSYCRLCSQHTCGYAGFGLGETGDLQTGPGLPQASSTTLQGATNHSGRIVALRVAVVGFRLSAMMAGLVM